MTGMWLTREHERQYDAVIFDFRGVLYLKTKSDRRAFFAYMDEELGLTSRDLSRRLPGLNDSRDPEEILRILEAIFECPAITEKLRQAPGVRRSIPIEENTALVRDLARTHRLGLLANSDGTAETRLGRMGLRPFFSSVIDSHVVGMRKPDPSIYILAARSLDTSIERCLFIDDRIENVEAARAAGMAAIHYCHSRGDRLEEQLARYGVLPSAAERALARVS